ncbi:MULTISPECIES: glycosyltransferase [Pseudomonas]|uniref:glycosyltransferase n=1 Tax=Pseudomonas TaxID=286 RepID=UPI0008EC0126|nr:glycosyltransferase [Pseudomonas marincola]SFT76670.1 rhamnosyltransferase [Pseudomonas marincola]
MPLEHPKVAVLLAAYNGMRWIEEQLNTILYQTDVKLTVFISIDPSTDGTELWCHSYAADNSNVYVLPSAGKFGGAALNFFRLFRDVDISSFDYVALSDQDDRWHSDKLSRAIKILESTSYDAYSSNVIAFWPSGKKSFLNKAQPQVEWDYLFEAAGPGCTYVFSKALGSNLKTAITDNWEAIQKVGLHDWYCYAYARGNSYEWYIDPVPSMDYRQHSNNQVGANQGLKPLIIRYKKIHNGWWFNQVKLIVDIIGKSSDPFVKKWLGLQPLHLLLLSFKAWNCRRRVRDKFLFFCICWLTALTGGKP